MNRIFPILLPKTAIKNIIDDSFVNGDIRIYICTASPYKSPILTEYPFPSFLENLVTKSI